MAGKIACIGIDWGTTNRRGWAFSGDGRIVGEQADGAGLLAVGKERFAPSFEEFTRPWRADIDDIPVIMCGMVGSKMGWVEAPYLSTPVDLTQLSQNLCEVPGVKNAWIVAGASDEHGAEPDVMRGEECQVFGALLGKDLHHALLVLPGTHSKWVMVENRRLARFRTYMTGELFGMLRSSGTLAQLMQDADHDTQAFEKGLMRMRKGDPDLTHALFGVRTFGLLGRLPPGALASYLSGLLVGAEFADALGWASRSVSAQPIIAIGSPNLLANYRTAARHFGVPLEACESHTLLPPALFALARKAGLVHSSR